MIGWLIVACEIMFWIVILIGLIFRYVVGMKKLGALFLMFTPVIDLVLLLATAYDLHNGAEAQWTHGLAAIYIGSTIAFGHQMIKWADERFAYRFAGGGKPRKKPRYGKQHAKRERAGWYRHVLAFIIGSGLLLGMIQMVGDHSKTSSLMSIIRVWALALGIDFLISFSYTLWPREQKETM
ncbi:hypothetical protein Q5741_19640 [Paenibacillus sp. JX-17]|uniref:2TM domain-containing protein n=1 Tax=Paenibacillus lacisoli TaxID=3064525 RepID=A0ABT9CIA7_9BACL|nr:hypothetical protein [Paenibacillus sp. JX-17]MDO7908605.1 hypothetical protein [Paenibacillus sp. JX-17]